MSDEMYLVRAEERQLFNPNWCGGDRFENRTPMLIAKFNKGHNSDGQNVEVYCTARPARSFTIKALDSINGIKKGFSLSTGSEMGELAKQMAIAISSGMLVVSTEKTK
jgi:hypothetical protein